jgi:D-beta-D-heptose 7-phosphate kinase/D-beta-D-heptose 1-phosphate adenosyltransferase
VPAGEPATTGLALADAVRAVGRDHARLDRVRQGGRRLCEQVFGWSPVVAAHEEIYWRTRNRSEQPVAGAVTSKLLSLGEAATLAARLRDHGKTIVLGGGCFDLLHVGHIRYLRAAKAAGDVLIVALNSDAGVRRLKGPDRPLLDERERAEILSEFGFVDYVLLFDDDTAANVLRELRPHFYAKGTDYTGQDVPGTADFLRAGGRMLFLGDDKTRSSTGYLERLRDA